MPLIAILGFVFFTNTAFGYSAILQNGDTEILATPDNLVTQGSAIAITSEGATTDGIDFRYDGYSLGSENSDPYVVENYVANNYSVMLNVPTEYLQCIDTFGSGGLSDYLTVTECQGLGYSGFIANYTVTGNGIVWSNFADNSSPSYDFSGLKILSTSTMLGATDQIAAATQAGSSTGFPFVVVIIAIGVAFWVLQAMFALMPEVPEERKKRSRRQ